MHGYRYEDLGPKERALRAWHRVLMIIPPEALDNGVTKEPGALHCYMLPVLWDLQRLGPRPGDFRTDVTWPDTSVPANERGMKDRCISWG